MNIIKIEETVLNMTMRMQVNINHFIRPSAVAYSSSSFYEYSLEMHYISLFVRLCKPFRINGGSPSINIE